MVVGISVIAALSHYSGYRVGGVMVVPLLVVYTFREPLSPIVFAVGAIAAWGALWAVREYTLSHGRRVFLVGVVSGVGATVVAAYVLATWTPANLPFDDAEVVASIFPGVAAYNVMRLDRGERVGDVLAMTAVFVMLTLLAAGLLFFFEGKPFPTPPVLALPTSDLVAWLGVEPRGEPLTPIVPEWLSVALLIADVSIYEAVRKRYDLRLAGIIVIPMLAVFSVRLDAVAAVFAVGSILVFALLSIAHWLSLLYGRVLLALSLVLGLSYALAVIIFVESALPGLTLFFLGLFVGIAAHNLFRASPPIRSASLRISAGLFVLFYAVLFAFVDIPLGGLFSGLDPGYLLVGLLAVGLAVVELVRLERSRPPEAAFARASVFAKASVDGTGVDSPLVGGTDASGSQEELTFTLAERASTDREDGTEHEVSPEEDES
jgi:hypothetical protein